jgi:hypothetical protein
MWAEACSNVDVLVTQHVLHLQFCGWQLAGLGAASSLQEEQRQLQACNPHGRPERLTSAATWCSAPTIS